MTKKANRGSILSVNKGSLAIVTRFINNTLVFDRLQHRRHCQELFADRWREEWKTRNNATK